MQLAKKNQLTPTNLNKFLRHSYLKVLECLNLNSDFQAMQGALELLQESQICHSDTLPYLLVVSRTTHEADQKLASLLLKEKQVNLEKYLTLDDLPLINKLLTFLYNENQLEKALEYFNLSLVQKHLWDGENNYKILF